MEWKSDFFNEEEHEEPDDNWPPPWKVVLYLETNRRFRDIVLEVQRAIGSSAIRAVELTLTAHQDGYAVVYEGDFFDCQTVTELLRQSKLKASIYG